MKIELKNIKYVPSLSEETNCFSAAVYVDGKKRGEASNRGTGGMTDVRPASLEAELNAYGATLPPHKISGKDFPVDAESIVDDLLEAELTSRHEKKERKRLERACAKRALFRVPGEPEGEYRQLSIPYGPAAVAYIRKKYGAGAVILNETLKETLNA